MGAGDGDNDQNDLLDKIRSLDMIISNLSDESKKTKSIDDLTTELSECNDEKNKLNLQNEASINKISELEDQILLLKESIKIIDTIKDKEDQIKNLNDKIINLDETIEKFKLDVITKDDKILKLNDIIDTI